MSLRAYNLVWERARAGGSRLLVLLAIADYARSNGRDSYASAQWLARKTRMTPRAMLLILHKLEADGEIVIEPNTDMRRVDEDGQVPRWFLHVRCVCDWPAYQAEKCEKISDSADDLSPPAGMAEFSRFPRGRTRKSEKISHFARTEKRKITYEKAKNHVRKSEKSGTPYKEGSGRDPVGIQRTGGCAPDSHTAEKKTDPPFNLFVKLAHEAFRLEGEQASLGEVFECLKTLVKQLRLPTDPRMDVAYEALEAARWQRQHRSMLAAARAAAPEE